MSIHGPCTYLLLRVSSSTRPFRNNVLPRLIVRRKSKRYAREGRSEIHTHDQLSLAPTSTLDFDGGVAQAVLLGHPWGDSMGGGRVHAVAGRGAHGLLGRRRGVGILHVGVNGGRVMGQLLLAWRERTRRSTKSVTGRATQGVLVHGEAGGGRAVAGERRTGGCTVGRDRDQVVAGDVRRRGNLVRRKGRVMILIAFGPEAERFKPGTHQVHGRNERTKEEEGRSRKEGRKGRASQKDKTKERQCPSVSQ